MSTRHSIIVSLILIPLLAGALLWTRLPDQMASHWNIHDLVDGHTSKFWGVVLMPLMSSGMLLLFLFIPSIDPLKANIERFRPIFNLFILLILVFLGYVWTLSILWNLGFTDFRMSMALLPALGLLFIFVGYMLSKAKRNWFIGIRTPWTLSSDRVWDETHRIGAVLFYISGVLAVLGTLFGSNAFWFVFTPIVASSIYLVVYSYISYKRETGT